jgi:hypothetical protein
MAVSSASANAVESKKADAAAAAAAASGDKQSTAAALAAESPATASPSPPSTPASNGGRRERKQKFDVRKLLNIRGNVSAGAAGGAATPSPNSASKKSRRNSTSNENSSDIMNHKTRRSGRVAAAAAAASAKSTSASTNGSCGGGEGDADSSAGSKPSTPAAATPVTPMTLLTPLLVCNDPHLKDSEHSIVLTGKRERKRKRFWDDEQEAAAAVAAVAAVAVAASNTSSASSLPTPNKQPKKSGGGGGGKEAESRQTTPTHKKSSSASKNSRRDRRSSGLDSQKQLQKGAGGNDDSKENEKTSSSSSSSSSTPVKLNGKTSLGYLQFDLSLDPVLIAKQMVEGVNIPGPGVPIPVDSTNLPEGWEKRVIQRGIGITKGKWDVFIQNPTGKSFRSKIELQRHFEEKKLPYSSETFDFTLDDNLKKLRQIWKQHIVIPQLKAAAVASAAAAAATTAERGSPADCEVGTVALSISSPLSSQQPPSAASPSSSASTGTTPLKTPSASTTTGDNSNRLGSSGCAGVNNSDVKQRRSSSPTGSVGGEEGLAEQLGVESETGQGLRCSIAGCRKLFRNDRLLQMHVKHYHPGVFEHFVQQNPLSVEDLATNRTSLSDELGEAGELWALAEKTAAAQAALAVTANSSSPSSPATTSGSRKSSQEGGTGGGGGASAAGGSGASKKRKLSYVEKSRVKSAGNSKRRLSHTIDADYLGHDVINARSRNRNDSILSVGSETSSIGGVPPTPTTPAIDESVFQTAASTPPTFRVSKRRQAQLKKKKNVSPPMKRKNKDDPYLEEFMSFLGKEQSSVSPAALSSASSATVAAAAGVAVANLSPAEAAIQSAPSSYPPSEMDASVASEHLTSEEVVNCTCKRTEEDGLMIQCDICLCWQHGNCLGVDDEDQVPEKHVCSICREPRAGRTEARFGIDQDWLKEGKLQAVPLPNAEQGSTTSTSLGERECAFRKLSELMADLANLSKVLHSIRVKLFVASQSNNSKVFMWSSPWESPAPPSPPAVVPLEALTADVADIVKKEPTFPSPEEDMPLGMAANDLGSAAERLLGRRDNVDGSVAATATANLFMQLTSAAANVSPLTDNAVQEPQQQEQPGRLQTDTTTTNPAIAESAAQSHPAPPPPQSNPSFPPTPSGGAGEDEQDDHLVNGSIDEINGTTPNATFASVQDEVFRDSITPTKAQDGGGANDVAGLERVSPQSMDKKAKAAASQQQQETAINGFKHSPPHPIPLPQHQLTHQLQPDVDASAVAVSALTPPDENDLSASTEDAEAEETTLNVDDNIAIDPSMIPSVSEVEQLLPSLIQAMQEEDSNAAAAAAVQHLQQQQQQQHHHHHLQHHRPPSLQPPPPQMPLPRLPPIIPEQKRIDKDECRLNLLEHIEKTQSEVDSMLDKVEGHLGRLEEGQSSGGGELDKLSGRAKAIVMALIHDLGTARKLVAAV